MEKQISVKAARVDAGFTQSAMAKALRISAPTYWKLEKNPEKMSISMANEFAKIVDRSVESIYFLPQDSN